MAPHSQKKKLTPTQIKRQSEAKIQITLTCTTGDSELDKRLYLAVDSLDLDDIVRLLGFAENLEIKFKSSFKHKDLHDD